MRIDFVITELFVGGAEKCLTEIAIALSRSGDQVRVFSIGTLPEGEQRSLVDRLEHAGVTVLSANCDSLWNFSSAYRFLRKEFDKKPPDVVQTFLHHANVLGTHAARSAKVGKCVGGIRVAQGGRLRNHLERILLRRADHILCVSQAVATFACETLGCEPSKTTVIPNGVDIEKFSHPQPANLSQIGWPQDSQILLFVGRLDHQKGIDLLQQQIDRIVPSGSNQRLLLIGDGPLRPELNAWCEKVGSHRVQLMQWQAEVIPWMKASTLIVLPSRYEGMPNVLLEAMAASRPVVCSLVEGSDELLGPSKDEQGFAPSDGKEMAERIESLLSSPDRMQRLAKMNFDRVRDSYSLSGMTAKYQRFYRNLLEAK